MVVAVFLVAVTLALGFVAMQTRRRVPAQPEVRLAAVVSFIVMIVVCVLYLLRAARGVLTL
jgi:hypothetical protein